MSLWKDVLRFLKVIFSWDKPSLLECCEAWFSNKDVNIHKALSCYVFWGVWLAINKMILYGKVMCSSTMSHHIRLSYGEHWKPPKNNGIASLKETYIWLLKGLDGACQGTSCMCGARTILVLNNAHCLLLKYGPIQVTPKHNWIQCLMDSNESSCWKMCQYIISARGLKYFNGLGKWKNSTDKLGRGSHNGKKL